MGAYRSSSHIGPRLPMRWRIEAQTMSSLIGARSPIMGRSRILAAFHRYLHGSCISSRRTYGPSYTTEASTRHCSKGSTSTQGWNTKNHLNQYVGFQNLVSRILSAFYRYLHGSWTLLPTKYGASGPLDFWSWAPSPEGPGGESGLRFSQKGSRGVGRLRPGSPG